MIRINKSLHGAKGKIKAVYLGTTPVVMYLGDQLLYDVDLDGEYVLIDIQDRDTVDSTIEAPVKSAILSGNTLVNVNIGFTSTWGGIIVSQSEVSSIGRITTTWGFDKSLLESNTKYLLLCNCKSNLDKVVTNGLAVYCDTGTNGYTSLKNGLISFTFTTGDISVSSNRVALGLQVGTGNECDVVFSNIMLLKYQDGMEKWDIPYFEGMQSVKMPVLTTTGKNLFDENKKIAGYIAGNSINENLQTEIKNTWTTYWIKAKPNTKYIISGGNRCRWQIKSISGVITYKQTEIITTLSDTEYIRCYYCSSDYTASNVQIEEGSVATSYEPYKSNILSTSEDVVLRGIGDVKDTLDLTTGEVTKRIEEIVLDGGDDEKWITASGGSATHKRFVLKRGNRIKPISNVNRNLFLCDKFNTVNSIKGDNYKEMCLMEEIDEWYLSIIIDNTKLNSLTVDGFKSWLQSNNVKMQYVVESESVKTVDLTITDQDNKTISTLNTFNDVTHFTVEGEDGSLQPIVSMEIACNPSQSVMALTEQTEQLQQEQQELTEQIEQQQQDTNTLQTATTDLEEV